MFYQDFFDSSDPGFGKPNKQYSEIRFYSNVDLYCCILDHLICLGVNVRSNYRTTAENKYRESSFVQDLNGYLSSLKVVRRASSNFGLSLKNLYEEYQGNIEIEVEIYEMRRLAKQVSDKVFEVERLILVTIDNEDLPFDQDRLDETIPELGVMFAGIDNLNKASKNAFVGISTIVLEK